MFCGALVQEVLDNLRYVIAAPVCEELSRSVVVKYDVFEQEVGNVGCTAGWKHPSDRVPGRIVRSDCYPLISTDRERERAKKVEDQP